MKGFAVSKNKYVLFEKDELDAVKLESTRIIDIEEFVDATSIDRIYWDEPYYLAPAGKTGIEAYAVIRAAMEKQGKVALGRVVMHQRERICALEPRDFGHPAHHTAHARRDPLVGRGVRPTPAQARSSHAGDRREDHRASSRPSSIPASSRTATRTRCAT